MPYTYLVTFTHPQSSEKLRYYGVRFAKGCDPNELGTKYQTSSRYVKSLIEEHGIECFEFAVRKTFKDAEAAIKWERHVLTRLNVLRRSDWINQSTGTSHRAADPRTPEHAAKISESLKGRKFSEETKSKLRAARKNRKPTTDETKAKMSETRRGRVFVSNSEMSKQIPREELNQYLAEGWIRGRKFGIKPGFKHSDEQKAKWSSERKGSKQPKIAEKRKGMVQCKDADGNHYYVTREEFQSRDDLFGIRKILT